MLLCRCWCTRVCACVDPPTKKSWRAHRDRFVCTRFFCMYVRVSGYAHKLVRVCGSTRGSCQQVLHGEEDRMECCDQQSPFFACASWWHEHERSAVQLQGIAHQAGHIASEWKWVSSHVCACIRVLHVHKHAHVCWGTDVWHMSTTRLRPCIYTQPHRSK